VWRIREIIEVYAKVRENLYLFYIAGPGVHLGGATVSGDQP